MMLGFCMVIGYVHDYLVILGPIALIYLLTMKAEEQRMLQKYGSRWTNYAVVTPRLLPLKAMNYTAAPWSPARWLQRREYRAIVTALAGLAALEWWRLSSDVF
jgi:hypothetical protein